MKGAAQRQNQDNFVCRLPISHSISHAMSQLATTFFLPTPHKFPTREAKVVLLQLQAKPYSGGLYFEQPQHVLSYELTLLQIVLVEHS